MSCVLRLPKLAVSMTEGILAEWLIEDGGIVKEGQPIYLIEADKAATEIESPASGRLRRIAVAGLVYRVGDEVGAIE